jgi:hypothetical protein
MTALVVVPNGTEIASPTYVRLLNDYCAFGKVCAEAIVGLGEICCEANRELTAEGELERWCKDAGLDEGPEGSTFRKFLKIGRVSGRFKPYMDRLPNTWTTVYKLASLDNTVPENEKEKAIFKTDFQKVVESPKFGPEMTAHDVTVILSPPKVMAPAAEKVRRDVWLDLSKLSYDDASDAMKAILALTEKLRGAKFDVSTRYLRLAETVRAAQANAVKGTKIAA